jgi:superfamily I DNA and/or RNA helicase
MFRGIEKDIIIVAPLRNSSVSGLGQLGDFIKLAMTRSRQYLWVVGSSVTLIG